LARELPTPSPIRGQQGWKQEWQREWDLKLPARLELKTCSYGIEVWGNKEDDPVATATCALRKTADRA
jgi:hypothetical protein